MNRPLTRTLLTLTLLAATLTGVAGCGGESDAARLYLDGDYEAAFKSFSRLADSGDSTAMNFVGIHYYLGAGVDRDLALAATWFERAALDRNPNAQRNLGVMYLRGWGVKKDVALAYGWLYEAVTRGNENARSYLRFASDYVTPNQSLVAREAVAKRIAEHAATQQ